MTESTESRDNEVVVTRSEEQVHVDTEQVETGTARLTRTVETEDVDVTVPVSHEELRVERTPVDGDARSGDGAELSEAEHEVVLHEERPVVTKETVPVEQVRVTTETVEGEETVTTPVSKERIDVDTDGSDGPQE